MIKGLGAKCQSKMTKTSTMLSVNYEIQPNAGPATGPTLGVQASIVFDTLVALLVRALVREAGLADVRDHDPVATQVDREVKRLVDRRNLPARERPIEWVFRPFALDRRDVSLSFPTKLAQNSVGEFAVGLDVLLARDRVSLGVVDRAGVAKQFTEDVVDEVAENLLLVVGVNRAGGDNRSPLLQLLALMRDLFRQAKPQER
jgi:hypothetical protein